MAFTARYGSTGPEVTRHMTVRDLRLFAEALGEILREEAEASRPRE